MDMMLNARNADMQGLVERIFLGIKKYVMPMQRNGIKIIEILSISVPEKGTLKIKLRLLSEIENMLKKLKLNIWFNATFAGVKLLNLKFAQYVIVKVGELKDTMQIIPNLWKLYGFVLNAITIFINLLRNMCSLNDQTHRALNERMRWPDLIGNYERESEISPRFQVIGSQQVTGRYQGQCINFVVHLKLYLIDSEIRRDDEGQAQAA